MQKFSAGTIVLLALVVFVAVYGAMELQRRQANARQRQAEAQQMELANTEYLRDLASQQVTQLATIGGRFLTDNGRTPTLGELLSLAAKDRSWPTGPMDPWGTPWKLDGKQVSGSLNSGVHVISAGPDRKAGTYDDIWDYIPDLNNLNSVQVGED